MLFANAAALLKDEARDSKDNPGTEETQESECIIAFAGAPKEQWTRECAVAFARAQGHEMGLWEIEVENALQVDTLGLAKFNLVRAISS